MIISLRGTSGSGKSHLVREVVSRYERHRKVCVVGRRQPYYVLHGRNRRGQCLVVPGHYEIANGGVDTLRTLDEAYAIARWAANCRHDVLMEGKNMSDGVYHLEGLMEFGLDCRVVHVNVPIEECVAAVRERGHKISEASIIRTDAKVRRDMERFTCKIFSGNRDECLAKVLEWLGLETVSLELDTSASYHHKKS